jgi:dGTP triphosphohydrolase
MEKHYQRMLKDQEERVIRSLQAQILDKNNSRYGGFADWNGMVQAKNSIYSIAAMVTAYCNKEDIPQIVTDYISGMSDQYAIRRYMDIFIPKPLAEQSNDDALFRRIQDEIH